MPNIYLFSSLFFSYFASEFSVWPFYVWACVRQRVRKFCREFWFYSKIWKCFESVFMCRQMKSSDLCARDEYRIVVGLESIKMNWLNLECIHVRRLYIQLYTKSEWEWEEEEEEEKKWIKCFTRKNSRVAVHRCHFSTSRTHAASRLCFGYVVRTHEMPEKEEEKNGMKWIAL